MHIVKKQNQSMTLDGTTLSNVLGEGDGGSDSFPFALYEGVIQKGKKAGMPSLKQVPDGSFAGCQILKSDRQGIFIAQTTFIRKATEDEINAFEGRAVASADPV
jgi:hypothetical protein